MSNIPYLIKKHSLRELDDKDFHAELMKQSMGQPYELKQVVPIVSDGETENAYLIYALNRNLIETVMLENGEYVDSKYLPGEQIMLLKSVGTVEVNGENKNIEEISIKWNADSVYGIQAEIKIK